jgi:hypothetical protein
MHCTRIFYICGRQPSIHAILRAREALHLGGQSLSIEQQLSSKLSWFFSEMLLVKSDYYQIQLFETGPQCRELIHVTRWGEVPQNLNPEKPDRTGPPIPTLEILGGLGMDGVSLSEIHLNTNSGEPNGREIPTLRAAAPVQSTDGKMTGFVLIDMDMNAGFRELFAAVPGVGSLQVTVSIGLSHWSGEDESFEALMTRSDNALKTAKSNGCNQICIRAD